MMKLQENSKQLSFLIKNFPQKPTFEVLSTNLKTLTANKLCFLVQLVIRGFVRTQQTPPGSAPAYCVEQVHFHNLLQRCGLEEYQLINHPFLLY